MSKDKPETGLIGGVERRVIQICDYDPEWPQRFQEQAQRIREALGAAALSIEHIGSTSVPGLGAKPIVDLLLVVADAADEASYLPQLEEVGYELRVREPDFEEHRMLRTPKRDVHIHVFSSEATEIKRLLAFRDRLRTHPEDRQRYEQMKRQLAQRDWSDMNAYADAKSEVVEQIIRASHVAGNL
ncbi:dephospho-CoA kinase/protein folding accessory domain-containing protein [Gimesia alba]|uniref:Dephospho-CoA kinase/protein folding accessory domain-containing protein n=1 Tax=Gimesia alba TaxID=2527973 RepID=A0A517RAL1_9PLAN|nr:GrpB family protein [Gimesia alba]QDT40910.1 dephospho-CoA kinase/protein folding accessory domain-containing protein [Gimesia alba]